MTPRLLSSKKWTPFPQEFATQIQDVFQENFSQQLQKAQVLVEGRIYPQEILLRVGFLEADRLVQPNFETSVEYLADKDQAMESIHLCIDTAASMMQEYFTKKDEEDEVDLPYTWKPLQFKNHEVFVQFTTVNSRLEDEANRLLGEAGHSGLVQGEVDEEDLLGVQDPADDHHDHEHCDHDHSHDDEDSTISADKAKSKIVH
ncbi:MAG: hypothetical protein ACOYOK_09360 [Pseudobdellovibrionaceae bacterium]